MFFSRGICLFQWLQVNQFKRYGTKNRWIFLFRISSSRTDTRYYTDFIWIHYSNSPIQQFISSILLHPPSFQRSTAKKGLQFGQLTSFAHLCHNVKEDWGWRFVPDSQRLAVQRTEMVAQLAVPEDGKNVENNPEIMKYKTGYCIVSAWQMRK